MEKKSGPRAKECLLYTVKELCLRITLIDSDIICWLYFGHFFIFRIKLLVKKIKIKKGLIPFCCIFSIRISIFLIYFLQQKMSKCLHSIFPIYFNFWICFELINKLYIIIRDHPLSFKRRHHMIKIVERRGEKRRWLWRKIR